jgi:hypothetical protein
VPRVGGETGIADELAQDPSTGQPVLVRGHIIEPRPGRLSVAQSALQSVTAGDPPDGRSSEHAAPLNRALVHRTGRLVLFSGGGENYHSPIELSQGRRTTFHVWFHCDCEKDKGSVGRRPPVPRHRHPSDDTAQVTRADAQHLEL